MKIYKITSPNTELVYVGKTIKTLERRMSLHRCVHKRHLNGKADAYCTAINVLECGDAVIELIEEFDGDTDDARRETFWIKELNACNQVKMRFDWSNKAERNKYGAEYRKANRAELNRKQLEQTLCDHCGGYVTRSYLPAHKKTKKCINNPLQINSL